jgi:uncharacterized Zn finger protein
MTARRRHPPRSPERRGTPRPAEGGIRARTRHGGFASKKWTEQWLKALDSFHQGANLERGRSYARAGQVTDLLLDGHRVEARVQGSRPEPYRVEIVFEPLSDEAWKRMAARLRRQPLVAAKLVAGELPDDLESLFADVGSSLFPNRARDLEARCSCPNWANPCEHLAAVYFLVAEEIDRDPFLLLELRGLPRHRLIGDLVSEGKESATPEPAPAVERSEPLPADPVAFWRGSGAPDGLYGHLEAPDLPAPLLQRLGGFPFWRAEETVLEALAPVYEAATRRSLELFLAPEERGGEEEPPEP